MRATTDSTAYVALTSCEVVLFGNKCEGESESRVDRALLSLPKRKHIKLMSRAPLLDYRFILCNYLKRVDLWNVYLDQVGVNSVHANP